jgi:hypothetical protein
MGSTSRYWGTGVLPTPCNPTCSKNIFGIALRNPENNGIYKSECNTGLGGTVTPSLVGFVKHFATDNS